MCLICESLTNKKITLNEARKNAIEFRIFDNIDDNHYYEVIKKISDFQKIEDEKTNKMAIKK